MSTKQESYPVEKNESADAYIKGIQYGLSAIGAYKAGDAMSPMAQQIIDQFKTSFDEYKASQLEKRARARTAAINEGFAKKGIKVGAPAMTDDEWMANEIARQAGRDTTGGFRGTVMNEADFQYKPQFMNEYSTSDYNMRTKYAPQFPSEYKDPRRMSVMEMADMKFNTQPNIKPFSGASTPALRGAGLNAGLAILSMADQAAAASGAYGNSVWDTEYGRSDPLSVRTLYNFVGDLPTYGTEGARERYRAMVNNPEWVERNPIGAVLHNLPNIYNGFEGNYYYPKAFIQAYTPENLAKLSQEMFMQSASQPRPAYNPLSAPMR